jgi:hypothetical protein
VTNRGLASADQIGLAGLTSGRSGSAQMKLRCDETSVYPYFLVEN